MAAIGHAAPHKAAPAWCRISAGSSSYQGVSGQPGTGGGLRLGGGPASLTSDGNVDRSG